MSFRRMAGFAGVAFFIVNVAGFIMGGQPPAPDDPASKITQYIVDGGDTLKFGLCLTVLGILAFIPFIAGFLLPFWKSDREHGEGYGVLVLVGAVLTGGAASVGNGAAATLALRAGAELDAAATRALWDLSTVAYGIAIACVTVVGLGTAVAVMERGVMPRWFGVFSTVVGILGLTGLAGAFSASGLASISLLGFVAFMLWVLVAGIVMLREPAAPAPAS